MAIGDIIGYAHGYKSTITDTKAEYLDTSESVIEIPIVELNKPRSELYRNSDHACDWTSLFSASTRREYAGKLPIADIVALVKGLTFSVGGADGNMLTFRKHSNEKFEDNHFVTALTNAAENVSYTGTKSYNDSDTRWIQGFTFGYSPEANAYFPVVWSYRYYYGESQGEIHLGFSDSSDMDTGIVDYWPASLEPFPPVIPVFMPDAMLSGLRAGRQAAGQRKG